MSEDDEDRLARFKVEALRIHQAFEDEDPLARGLQNEVAYEPPTVVMLIHDWALLHAADHYAAASIDRHEPGVINVGFTADAHRHLAALRAAFPAVEIHPFNARFSHKSLARIQDEITNLMCSRAVNDVYSCGVEEERNVVHVGVADLASDEAQALVAAYGDAIDVCPDEPIELL